MSNTQWPVRVGQQEFYSMREVEEYCFQHPEFEDEYDEFVDKLEMMRDMDTYLLKSEIEYGDIGMEFGAGERHYDKPYRKYVRWERVK